VVAKVAQARRTKTAKAVAKAAAKAVAKAAAKVAAGPRRQPRRRARDHRRRGQQGQRRRLNRSRVHESEMGDWAGGAPRSGCDGRIRGCRRAQGQGEGPGHGCSGPNSIHLRGQAE
jgi:hypothetical protein